MNNPLQSLPIFDLNAAAQLAGGNLAFVEGMLEDLLKELPSTLNNIEQAFHNKDWALLEEYVHKLHGGLVYTGTPRLKAIAQELNKKLRHHEAPYDQTYAMLIEQIHVLQTEYPARQ